MILTVLVPDWELEESGRVLRVGDEISSWLTFEEATEVPWLAAAVQTIVAVARPLPDWEGGTLRCRPTRIELPGGVLYWDASASVAGVVELVGSVSTNTIDAPDGFPETSGSVRRIRMVWQDVVMDGDNTWRPQGDPSYEEVPASYLPRIEPLPIDPEIEAAQVARAREWYERLVAEGEAIPGEPFSFAFQGSLAPPTPPGTTEGRWAGVLIDLEIAGA